MPTDEQERAIHFGDGNLLLIACAGSGKTETITRRIVRLIADGVPPESIVAFTFTRRAAREMATRIYHLLSASVSGDDDFAGLYVGTIHSYCHQRLKQTLPQYQMFDLLDNEDMRMLFCRRYFGDIGLERLLVRYNRGTWDPSPFTIINDFCSSADLVRNERIDPGTLDSPFRECYFAYLDCLLNNHYLDFSGMIANYVQALEKDQGLLMRERARVRHLIVDEYQDVNALQEALIRLMAGENGNLCVAGDDDQCIYHWRGSNNDHIVSFRTRYPNVTPFRILQNFRSTPGVINAAAKVIDNNIDRFPKAMGVWPDGRGTTEEGDIAACFFTSEEAEVSAIVDQIQLLNGYPYMNNRGKPRSLRYADMGILMRSVKAPAKTLLPALRQAGIRVVVEGGQLFTRPEVEVIMRAFAYLGGFPYPLRLLTPMTLARVEESYIALEWEAENVGKFRPAMKALRREADGAETFSLQLLYQQILQAMGSGRAPFPDLWFFNLAKLSRIISAFENVYPQITRPEIYLFLRYVQDHASYWAKEGGTDEGELLNAVTVATLHGAKGLQFPVVFIPRLNADEFPSEPRREKMWFVHDSLFDRDRYQGNLEDDRRLFYVGITRSEKYLFLSGHGKGSGEPMPDEHSIFFDEYPKDGIGNVFPVTPTATAAGSADVKPPAPILPLVETSWSALRYYARCPFGYKLRFVYGFHPVPRLQLDAGRAVHSVLAAIHQQAWNGGGVFYTAEIPSLIDKYMVLRFASQETVDLVKGLLQRQTLRYVQQSRPDFGRIIGIEQPFRLAFEGGLVRGQMDLLLDDGDGGIEIRDFKLSKGGATENQAEAERQLQVYALAAATLPPEVRQGRDVRRATIYAFDTGATMEVPVGPEALAEAQDELERMIAGIGRQEFPYAPDPERCAGCDWNRICCGKPAAQ